MAKGTEGRQEEINALMDIPGTNPEDIMAQVTGKKPDDPKPGDPQPGDPKPGDPQPGDPKPGDPKPGDPKPGEPSPEIAATGILKEIFGDQFSTIDELKKSNIPVRLKEIETLRQQNEALLNEKTELTSKLGAKPKHNFANDDIALYNEFVKTTGIKNFDVFNKINVAEVANMDYMNALVLQRMIENPELAGQEVRVRKYLEKKYNVDPAQITDPEELEENKIGLAEDGARAKTKLVELKGKLKLPEPDSDDPGAAPKWSPEKETAIKTGWGQVSETMGTQLATIGIPMKGMNEPIVNFAIPEEARKAMMTDAVNFAVSNRMEINKDTMTKVAKFMYSEYLLQNLGEIAHSIFEKARSMTQEELLEKYHNPSGIGGDGKPPVSKSDVLDDDAKRKKALDAEMGRFS
jgi:hypothetical protein